jgi:hypothetical protein
MGEMLDLQRFSYFFVSKKLNLLWDVG